MERLGNKVAIVTGASKGIGASIAGDFGAEGAAVVVNYARDHEGAERVVREITAKAGVRPMCGSAGYDRQPWSRGETLQVGLPAGVTTEPNLFSPV